MVNEGPRVRDGRALVPLRVVPKSRTNAVDGWENGRLKVRVTAAPDKGKANKAVLDLMAREWGLNKSALSIVSGFAGRDKLVEVKVPGDPDEWLKTLESRC